MDTIASLQYLYTQNQTNICNADADALNHHQWCTFQATDSSTFIVELVYFLVILATAGIAIKNYKKVCRYEKNARYRHMFGDAYFWMHQIIFGWLGCTLVKLIINLTIYLGYMCNETSTDDSDPQKGSFIVVAASCYQLFDFGCGFLINLLQILVFFQFIKNLIGSISQSQIITFKIKSILKVYLSFLNGVRLYCKYIRNIIFVLIAVSEIVLFYFVNLHNKCQLFLHLNYYMISGEIILIVLFYLSVGIVLLFLSFNQMLKIQSDDFKRLFKYSLLFTISLFLRVGLNFFFTEFIFKQNYYNPNKNCKNTDDSMVIVLIFHHSIMHILPIWLILYIYRPTLSKYEMESLLDNKSENSFVEQDISYKSISVNFYKDSITEVPKLEQNKLKQPIQYT